MGTPCRGTWTMVFCFLQVRNRPKKIHCCSDKMVSGWSSYFHPESHPVKASNEQVQSLSPKMGFLPHWTSSLIEVVLQDAVKIYLELYVAAPSWAVDDLKTSSHDLQEGKELEV